MVNVFRDGRHEYADETEEIGSTALCELPVPPLAEIAADPEFEPIEISKQEFEVVWLIAHQS